MNKDQFGNPLAPGEFEVELTDAQIAAAKRLEWRLRHQPDKLSELINGYRPTRHRWAQASSMLEIGDDKAAPAFDVDFEVESGS